MWNGSHGCFDSIWSLNMIEYLPGKFINYLALGNHFSLGKLTVFADFMNRSLVDKMSFLRDFTLIGKVAYSFNDKLNVFDMGGDDYIAKPYSLKELMSRIRSILRRTYGVDDNKSEMLTLNTDGNEIEINRHARTVNRNKSNVDMKPKEFDLLVYMAENRGRVLTKEQIMSAVWGLYSDVEPSTVAVHVRWLREKLETDPSHPQLIRTVWGTGYVLGDSE